MAKQLQRYGLFALGLAINAFGIAFVTKSALGTSQISSVPYVFSLAFPQFSFGACTFLVNALFLLGQILLLRRKFPPIQFLQLAVTFFFSIFIDLSMAGLFWLSPESLWLRVCCLLAGCLIIAVGLSIELAPQVLLLPGDGLVRVLARKAGHTFGTVKMLFDITLIIIASVCSFFFFHTLRGVGAGTIVSALIVGRMIDFFNRTALLRKLQRLGSSAADPFPDNDQQPETTADQTTDPDVVSKAN